MNNLLANGLIVYFSRSGENYLNGSIRKLPLGNTEIASGILQNISGFHRFQILPVKEYSSDYYTCIDEARQDLNKGVRPELRFWPDAFEQYHIICLGYPNYWGTMPVAVFSFLERYDFTGKYILPFCTHEGGEMGRSEADIKRLCPSAEIYPGLPIRGAAVRQSCQQFERWIQAFADKNKL